jgi:branched-chain amino acid transport system permease protein
MDVPTSSDVTRILILALLTYSMALPLRCGLFSIAPAAFAAIGAYVSALLTIHEILPMPLAIAAATLSCAAAGLILALPLVRVQGIYTAIVTLAFVVITTGAASSLEVTGGTLGLAGVPFADLRLVLCVALVLAIAGWVWLDHSALGRRIDVVGRDPLLASTVGVEVRTVRLAALVVSATIAGFAGALYAHSFHFIYPPNFDFYFALIIAVYVVIGGVTHWAGPILTVVVLAGVRASVPDHALWADAGAGAAMILVMVLYPDGVGGALRRHLRGARVVRSLLRRRPLVGDA